MQAGRRVECLHMSKIVPWSGETSCAASLADVAALAPPPLAVVGKNPLSRRVCWALVWCGALIYLLVFIFGTAMPALNGTATLTTYDSKFESAVTPPSMTFCNTNPFPASKFTFERLADVSYEQRTAYNLRQNLTNPFDEDEPLCELGDALGPELQGEDCTRAGFWVDYMDASAGWCSTFHFNANVTVRRPGVFAFVTMFEDPVEVQPYVAEAGVTVSVHARGAVQSLDSSVHISPGTQHQLRVQHTTIVDYKPFASPKCAKDAGDFPSYAPNRVGGGAPSPTQPYSVENCQTLCVLEKVHAQCGCLASWLDANPLQPTLGNLTSCEAETSSQDCEADAEASAQVQCLASCPAPCERDEYAISTSTAETFHEYGEEMVSLAFLSCALDFERALDPFIRYGVDDDNDGVDDRQYRVLDDFPSLNTSDPNQPTPSPPDCGASAGSPEELVGDDDDALDPDCASISMDTLAQYLVWMQRRRATLDLDDVHLDTLAQEYQLQWLLNLWDELRFDLDILTFKGTLRENTPSTLGGLYSAACGSRTTSGADLQRPYKRFISRAVDRAAGVRMEVSVGFETLVHTVIEKKAAYTINNFLSDIGGEWACSNRRRIRSRCEHLPPSSPFPIHRTSRSLLRHQRLDIPGIC